MNQEAQQDLTYHHEVTHNTEEHSAAWRGWQITCDQVTDGKFEGEVTELAFSDLQLIRDRSNQALVKTGQAMKNFLTFSVPARQHAQEFYCEGHLSVANHILIAPGDRLPEIHTPSNLDIFCISVDLDVIKHMLNNQGIESGLNSYASSTYLKEACFGEELSDYLHTIFSSELSTQVLEYSRIQDGIKDTIMQHLIDLADAGDNYAVTPLARKVMVDRAREYVLANLDTPPTILELCNVVGASRRKLQYCFQETFGLSPVSYLRIMRLNAAHRDLLHYSNQYNIQDVAAKWGFLHYGRFASEYRTLFAELPSQTIKRAS